MSRLIGFDTHRLSLGTCEHGEEWVEVRDALSYVERQVLNKAMFTLDGLGEVRADIAAVGKAHMEAYVTGWNIYGPDGQPVPFSVPALGRLDTATAEVIINHINEITADPEKNAETPSPKRK